MVTSTPLSSATAQQPKLGFRPDIQGLRAVAVLLVVTYHAGVPTISGGYVGVDVFFVISGFLITTHLLESLQREGRICLGEFYAKRARRILPASLAVLMFTVVAAMIWIPPLQLGSVFKGAIATVVYAPNMFFALKNTNYLAETSPSVFQHYWSLGVEEQFYLVWPLALILVFKVVKSERVAFWVVFGLVCTSFMACLLIMPVSQPWAFFSLPTRAWELGVGALMAFVMRAHGPRLAVARSGFLVWIGLAGLLIISVTYSSDTPFPGYYAAAPVIATALIIAGGVGRSHPTPVLSNGPMQFVGLISYSLYLVHWPLLIIPQAAVGLSTPLPLWMTLGLGAVSFPIAYLVYRFIEEPARKFQGLTQSKPRITFLAVGVMTVAIVFVLAATLTFTEQKPLHAGRHVSESASQVLPSGTEFVPSNLQPSLRAAADDNPLIYSNGCHLDFASVDASGCQFGFNQNAPMVALFGDSHAASWFPALHAMAEDGKIRLSVKTKGACVSADVPSIRYGQPYPSCDEWRLRVIDRLLDERPDIVLLANHGINPLTDGSVGTAEEWRDAVTRTTKKLSEVSEVGIIADVPDMGANPAICLSANLEDTGDCARPRDEVFVKDLAQAEQTAAQMSDATYIDFSDYLCNESSCPPLSGSRLIYRDAHHLTATYSASLERPLEQQLSPLLSE